MLNKLFFACVLLLAPTAGVVFSDDAIPPLSVMFWGRTTLGQVVSSASEAGAYDYDFQKEWLENFEGGVRLGRQISPSLYGRFHMGLGVNTSTIRQKNFLSAELTARKFTAALLDASLQYTHAGLLSKADSLQIELGYFPFRYNPQATSLGEYLFRSGTYPGVLFSGFENANNDKTKVGGIHLGYVVPVPGSLKFDLLLTSELDIYPLHDLNLTGIATYAPHPVFTVATGVEFAHCIVLDDRKTTPGLYQRTIDQWVGYIDTATNDTTIYSFKGSKIMGRATFDLKTLIEHFSGTLPFFGREDLKLYGEMAILGVKNYPGWYADRKDRIPVMFGINWPTNHYLSYSVLPGIMGFLLERKTDPHRIFNTNVPENLYKAGCFELGGILFGTASWLLERFFDIDTKADIISIEGEYYPSKFANSQEFIWKSRSPVPYTGSSAGLKYQEWNDQSAKTDDDWKWSVYVSKKIGTRFKVSAQAASDHTPRNAYTPGPPSFVKYTEMVPRTIDWYWMTRIAYYF